MAKLIPLTKGKFAIVDDADYEWLNQWKWCAMKSYDTFYAVRNSPRSDGKRTKILMHREILGLEPSDPRECDHKNHNGLDNRRFNLRVSTHAQNMHNQKPYRICLSAYKGVSWHKLSRKWQAQIQVNGKQKYLGCFNSEIDAALAYDKKAKDLFGEYAFVNFKSQDSRGRFVYRLVGAKEAE